jgi:protein involved in polysaccharide export with SLBB domain
MMLSHLLSPRVILAQSMRDAGFSVAQAGRRALDSLANVAARDAADPKRNDEDRARSASTALAIRTRLREGDFRVGDHIELFVRADTALSKTFTVREGTVLVLPNLPEIPLRGLLRSEAEARIRSTIATYFRDPDVKVNMLVRVGVLGQVVRPGYYQLATDALLSDALMAAGGPLPTASSDRVTVRHAGAILWEPANVREFLASGATLAQVDLHSGDEIVLEERKRRDWMMITQILVAVAGASVSVLYAVRH